MKREKLVFALYIVASICFFISAILGFITKQSMAVVYLCLGACFLCLASVHYNKYKESKKEDKKDNE